MRLFFRDGRPAELISREPEDRQGWKSRLSWLEKSEATVLLNPPVVYKMTWPAGRGAGSGTSRLRLSAALSLSIGVPLARRYVFTLQRGARRATIEEGGHLPARGGAETTILSALPEWAERELAKLVRALSETCDDFAASSQVQEAVRVIAEKRRTELTYLEQLYSRRKGREGRLYGLPEPGVEGSAAIEAELRRLQATVLERYAPAVRIRVLSLGVLQGTPATKRATSPRAVRRGR